MGSEMCIRDSIQALVGEGVHVTARVAAQLRSLSDFDVAQYGPPSHGDFIPDIMIADRLVGYRRISPMMFPVYNG